MPSLPRRRLPRLLAVCCCFAAAACDPPAPAPVAGDPKAGRRAIAAQDCGVCHTVPGVRGAHGAVGPSLAGFAERRYIAGVAPNDPATLIRWLRDPPGLAPDTAMPRLPIGPQEAQDIAAYLYTLR